MLFLDETTTIIINSVAGQLFFLFSFDEWNEIPRPERQESCFSHLPKKMIGLSFLESSRPPCDWTLWRSTFKLDHHGVANKRCWSTAIMIWLLCVIVFSENWSYLVLSTDDKNSGTLKFLIIAWSDWSLCIFPHHNQAINKRIKIYSSAQDKYTEILKPY